MKNKSVCFLFALVLASSAHFAYTQVNQTTETASKVDLKILTVAPDAKSDSVIAIPPATSTTINFRSERRGPTIDLAGWLKHVSGLNGLESTSLEPWHIVIAYEEFDKNGNSTHRGTYEELWSGFKMYRRAYKSDNFNQTDYANERGLFRDGDQQWPRPTEVQVRAEIIEPFSYAMTLQGLRARTVDRTFNANELQCVFVERESMTLTDPTQYCFEPGGAVLRYARGFGWFQTVYNGILTFQGRNIAQDVQVTDGGKPYLKLHVETIEMTQNVDDSAFVAPASAVNLIGKRVSGVSPRPLRVSYAQFPASLRGQRLTVEVEIVIGKNGHVLSAHALNGPLEAQKACEDAARKWVYSPFLVLDEPVEVETKTGCTLG